MLMLLNTKSLHYGNLFTVSWEWYHDDAKTLAIKFFIRLFKFSPLVHWQWYIFKKIINTIHYEQQFHLFPTHNFISENNSRQW